MSSREVAEQENRALLSPEKSPPTTPQSTSSRSPPSGSKRGVRARHKSGTKKTRSPVGSFTYLLSKWNKCLNLHLKKKVLYLYVMDEIHCRSETNIEIFNTLICKKYRHGSFSHQEKSHQQQQNPKRRKSWSLPLS